MEIYEVVECPDQETSYTNKAALNPSDTFAKVDHIAVRYPKNNEAFVFSVIPHQAVSNGKIAFNLSGRKWASLLKGSRIEAAPYLFERSQCLYSITFTIDFLNAAKAPTTMEFNTSDMNKQFSLLYNNQAFTVGQLFGFPFAVGSKKVVFELKVKELEAIKLDDGAASNVEIGLTTSNTIVMFEKADRSQVKLVGENTSSVATPQLFSQNWDFASMGIGGLGEQFNKIFRRAFASRLLPPNFAEAIGEEHVRGILLYGPPGTGKTLIARQIGKMLLAREPKIVNGPEVLDKYVGESEANIRKLFKDAEEEQAKLGINSGLHMIIFDEIDAICKSRGTSAGSAGVGDNVVNQLLSKIDGVNSLNNVLLVGMTNRKDLIDEALLRPGRLEVQIEIGLPNKEGRYEIFKIHTSKMRQQGVLDETVELDELAELAKNYTGAEIAGLIKAARSLAINRIVKPDSKTNIDKEMLKSIRVTREDFIYAMKHDVKPALGASEDQLKGLARPILHWDPLIAKIQSQMDDVIKFVSDPDSGKDRPYHVLLVGDRCSGLTTLAANMAVETKFPFIRVYQAITTADWTESNKVQYLKKLFSDAARSEFSCVILDDLDAILDYCHIGPRYSHTSRAVFNSTKDLLLPEGHRMLVISTCSNEQSLNDMVLFKCFRKIIKIPSLNRPEHVESVLTQQNDSGDSTFTPQLRSELVNALESIPFKMGIKELEQLTEDAALVEPKNRINNFLEGMHMLKLVIRQSALASTLDWSVVG